MPVTLRTVVVILLIVTGTVHAGPGLWTSSGPDGGRVTDIVADPAMPGVFYASARGGVYKTTDGGLTWMAVNNGITATSIDPMVHHRTVTDIVYVGGLDAVFKTIDGGLNWNSTGPGLPVGDTIFDLSLAPLNPDTVYAATIDDGVYKTTDGGGSWVAANTGLTATINAVQVSPLDSDRVYAGVSPTASSVADGLWETIDGGTSWVDVTANIGAPFMLGQRITDIEFAGFAGEIYLATSSGVYKSSDNGISFIHQPGPFGSDLSVNPSNSNELILSGSTGVWQTVNGGTLWTQNLADFPGNATEPATSTVTVFDPFNPQRKLAGSDSNGTYLQTMNGLPWAPTVTGMNSEVIRGLAVHPVTTSRVYAGIGDVFSPSFVNFISDDSGLTWSQSNAGLTGLHFRDIEVDPFTAASVATTHVYAVGRDFPVTDLMGGFSNGDGAIYKSTDGGSNWITIDNGIPLSAGPPTNSLFGTVRDITLDMGSSVMGGPVQTLYVAGTGRFSTDGMGGVTKLAGRIYKSTDAGASWTVSDTGIDESASGGFPYPSAVKIVIDPTSSNTLYASTFLAGYDPSGPPPSINNGVWKSIDGGANWVHSSAGLPTVGGAGTSTFSVLSLAIDPVTPSRLYASATDLDTFDSQIYKTEDSGATWVLANSGIVTSDIRDIIVDSTGTVYAAAAGNSGNPGGVYRSVDFGASWQSISVGLDSVVSALQLVIDESGVNPILYAGTTQSVHSYEILPDPDTDGVPTITEDAAPNNGDGNSDAVPDSDQGNVTSLPADPVDSGVFRAVNGQTGYVTIEVTAVTGTCAALEDVQSLTDLTVPTDAPRSYDFGVIRFEIVDCEEATVRLIFHDATDFSDPAWGFRIFAPTQAGGTQFSWQDFQAITSGNEWELILADGQLGDVRPNNGRILFQGGPGFFNDDLFEDGFED